jgi:GntR family transcriptional regulator, rspAB operon transcriptional repressor
MASVEPIQRGPHPGLARAQVYDVLREQIVSLRVPPGERVSDSAWAAKLGVSRTPVREAVLQLAEEGLIEIVPQHRTVVARISPTAVREAQFVREALETASLRIAVERLSTDAASRIKANLAEQRQADADGDADRFYALDQAFHRMLLDASGHPDLWRVAQHSRADMDRVRRLTLPEPHFITNLIDQHELIAQRLLAGDGPGAEDALREHLRLVAVNLPKLIEQHPDYFERLSTAWHG